MATEIYGVLAVKNNIYFSRATDPKDTKTQITWKSLPKVNEIECY